MTLHIGPHQSRPDMPEKPLQIVRSLEIGICSVETKQLGFPTTGWQQRLPLVALRSKPAILQSWGPACGGVVPRLRRVPFAAVRHLSPRDFVNALARDLKASGVVVGSNYRFGHKVRDKMTYSAYCFPIILSSCMFRHPSLADDCIWCS